MRKRLVSVSFGFFAKADRITGGYLSSNFSISPAV
jgi:hypothetical protein